MYAIANRSEESDSKLISEKDSGEPTTLKTCHPIWTIPEVCAQIAAHLRLRHLYSLLRVNQQLFQIVVPLLYRATTYASFQDALDCPGSEVSGPFFSLCSRLARL